MFAYGTTRNGVAKLKVFTTTLSKQFRANYAEVPTTTKRLTTNHGSKKSKISPSWSEVLKLG
jgi:hypothetical protein